MLGLLAQDRENLQLTADGRHSLSARYTPIDVRNLVRQLLDLAHHGEVDPPEHVRQVIHGGGVID